MWTVYLQLMVGERCGYTIQNMRMESTIKIQKLTKMVTTNASLNGQFFMEWKFLKWVPNVHYIGHWPLKTNQLEQKTQFPYERKLALKLSANGSWNQLKPVSVTSFFLPF